MSEPFTIGALAVGGLAWISAAAFGGVAGNVSDRALSAALRDVADRIAGLRPAPDGNVLARAIRVAQSQALERLIRDYRQTERPEWKIDPATRPDIFFERSLEFSRRQLVRSRDDASRIELDITPSLLDAIEGIIAKPEYKGSSALRLAAIARHAEDAVLAELRRALWRPRSGTVRIPDGFIRHFRFGDGACLPFLELFGVYISEQMTVNERFRAVLLTVQLARVGLDVRNATDAVNQMVARFSPALDRVETALIRIGTEQEEQRAFFATLLRRISEDKGVPISPLQEILGRMGEADVPVEQIPGRLSAMADEYVRLRSRLSEPETSDWINVARTRARSFLDSGEMRAARAELVAARQRIRDARDDHARAEATLLEDEAAVDRLERRLQDAARNYEKAAALVWFDARTRMRYLMMQGDALAEYGTEWHDKQVLLAAIDVLEEARRLTSPTDSPVDWAAVGNNLGNALREVGRRDATSARIDEAIGVYRTALAQTPQDRAPLLAAMLNNNLGKALRALGERQGDTKLLEKAIEAHESALRLRPRPIVPKTWASTQNNLGLALFRLGEVTGENSHLDAAVTAFRAALEEFTPDEDPFEWAAVQTNLVGVLHTLATLSDDLSNLEEARRVLMNAVDMVSRKRFPFTWARLQVNLAGLLWHMGKGTKTAGTIEAAIAAGRAAVEVLTRDKTPFEWAAAHSNLAAALMARGEMLNDASSLEEALASIGAALEVRRPTVALRDWAHTQCNRAEMLLSLARIEDNGNRAADAVSACREALSWLTRDALPFEWAATQLSLGAALLDLTFRAPRDERQLIEAVDALSAALEVLGTSNDGEKARGLLAQAQTLRREREIP